MKDILDRIAVALVPWLPTVQPVLLLDSASCHLRTDVMSRATELGIWLVPIPASATWLVNPLDTAAFAGYKRQLRREYLRLRLQSPEGNVSLEVWYRAVILHGATFLRGKRWKRAFQMVGASGDQNNLSLSLRKHLGLQTEQEVGADVQALNPEAIQQVFPRGRRLNVAAYLRPLLEAAQRR